MKNEAIVLLDGDITKVKVDALVNAANSSLLGGGGVDGAIHQMAGPELVAECRTLNGCPTGEAKLTAGYNLPAAHVIHTVGPIWQGGENNEAELLATCYRNCFAIAKLKHFRSMAFPAISTGVYGFPKEPAARIAIQQTRIALTDNPLLEKILFVCHGADTRKAYEAALSG